MPNYVASSSLGRLAGAVEEGVSGSMSRAQVSRPWASWDSRQWARCARRSTVRLCHALTCRSVRLQSTLMSKLTGTHSEVSAIDFTTLTTVPGTVKVHGAPIQILDLRA